MESSGGGGGGGGGGDGGGAVGGSRRYGLRFSASNYIQPPLTALLEYLGVLRPQISHPDGESLIRAAAATVAGAGAGGGEVSIRIIGAGYQDGPREDSGAGSSSSPRIGAVGAREGCTGGGRDAGEAPAAVAAAPGSGEVREGLAGVPSSSSSSSSSSSAVPPSVPVSGAQSTEGEGNATASANGRDTSYQRYDIQQVARWIEQILPFSLLLLVVFIRQHLQGFFVSIWVAAVMFKSNDILRKQTALKGERRILVLVGIILLFIIHVFGVYWLYKNDDLIYPLVLLPPKETPLFWHAIFIIMVNDTMVRQASMIVKCVLLMYYKNSVGRNYRKQGRMLTLVEYLILLYRALLPASVWYKFFLNQEYGSLFSSLITGLYLTFKLTSVVEKAQSFIAALKALSLKEVHYGSHATVEQVMAAGDLCAICQEKIQAPILLRCKHIFCEDCVSEWFERERTCPLCRALVKPADLRSFGDGSTSLFFQLF